MMIRDDFMRQVDLDELTYQIFAGLRSWTPSVRKRVFAPVPKRRDVDIEIALDGVRRSLKTWAFIDSAQPSAAVPIAEIATALIPVIKGFPGAIPSLWMSGQYIREREAQAAAAILLAQALEPFEILSGVPLIHFGARVVFFTLPEAPAYAFAPRWP
ncbi:hypothetical protein [Sphingomonas sp.]|jgi:hypothetical protein|uniref:hypothetical protein n=1 Tax=Sphingomonas sp. TaxID=28214 RepID=UPI002E12DA29|nr:hypothetical protein [Sphingomonas sp.]